MFIINYLFFAFIYQFRPPTQNVKHQYIKYLDCINCPEWKEELNYWKNDKSYTLKIWFTLETMMLN